MVLKVPIETSRLLMRQERKSDAKDIYELLTDSEVMKYIGDGSIYTGTLDDVEKESAIHEIEWHNRKYGSLVIVDKNNRKFLGLFFVISEPHTNDVQIGFWLKRSEWGKGIATEASFAVLDSIFFHTQLHLIVATVCRDNKASIRVLEKVGMKYLRDIYHKKAGTKVLLYSITREECSRIRSTGAQSMRSNKAAK